MPVTVEDVRAYGTRPITVRTVDGTFSGSVRVDLLSDRAIVAMLQPDDPSLSPLVVYLDAILEIGER